MANLYPTNSHGVDLLFKHVKKKKKTIIEDLSHSQVWAHIYLHALANIIES